jgi:hypothetical protein
MTGQRRVEKATRGKAANSGELSDKGKTRLQGIGFSEELLEGLLMATNHYRIQGFKMHALQTARCHISITETQAGAARANSHH